MKFKWWLNLALATLALNITTFAAADEEVTAEEAVVIDIVLEDPAEEATDEVDFEASETDDIGEAYEDDAE